MTQRVKTVFLAAALVAAVFLRPVSAETTEHEIRSAIAQLSDDDPKKRDNAQEWLREIGPEAALLWSPEKDGEDPEANRRMRELLTEWNFASAAEVRDATRRVRVAPWEDLANLSTGGFFCVEDDRFSVAVSDHPGMVTSHVLEVLVTRPDLPVTAEAMDAALDADPKFTIYYVSGLNDDLTAGARESLARRLVKPDLLAFEESPLLLWRCGNSAPVLAMAREKHWPTGYRDYDVCSRDREVCEALAEAYDGTPEAQKLSVLFPAKRYADQYVQEGRPDLLARLDREVGEERLRKLLEHGDPVTRFRAAFRLALFGVVTEQLKGFRDRAAWGQDWDAAEFAKVAPLLAGKGVEEALRDVVDNPFFSDQARDAALLGLTARGRDRDITFVYTHLKDLPAPRQPLIAVGLAKLGSAAGVGVLTPLLTGLDYQARRDSNEALKKITGQDFGYDARGTLSHRCRAARKWAAWWKDNKSSFQPDVK